MSVEGIENVGTEGTTGGASTGDGGSPVGGSGKVDSGMPGSMPVIGKPEGPVSTREIFDKITADKEKSAASKTPATGKGEPPTPAAAYSPNFKYKVLKEEKELPDWAKPFITTPEMEKNFRDAFERADGLEPIKQHRDVLVQENTAMRQEWAPIVQDAQRIVSHLQKGDFQTFKEELKIDDDVILKDAMRILKLRENPQQKAFEENQRRLTRENEQLRGQVSGISEESRNLAVQQRTYELNTALASSEVSQAVSAYESAVGKPGEFRNFCIQLGQSYMAQGIDAPAEKVVQEALARITWGGQKPATPSAVIPGNGATATADMAPVGETTTPAAKPPVLPNLKGRGTSPAKKVFKSTDELRKHARSL